MDKVEEIKNRIIRIQLIDGRKVNGQVNINRGADGYDRLSDLIDDTNKDFIIVSKATVSQATLDNPVHHEVIFLNKRHIVSAVPEETQK